MPETLSYPYKPKPLLMGLVIVFFAICAAILANEALTNDRGLVLSGILRFSTNGASIFYAVLTALSVGFVGIGVWGLYKAFTSKAVLELTPTALLIPAKKGQVKSIAFADITDIRRKKVQKQEFIQIIYAEGKASVNKQMCPSKKVFNEIVEEITQRTLSAAQSRTTA